MLPTADLDIARKRLTALGFTVAPDGVHPFGTVNACVYFADGTFLEPLAIADAAGAAKAVAAGNVFVAHDRAYRAGTGEEGFSALVFGGSDADADHAEFVANGISAGPRLDFSRPFIDAHGREDEASFRLAFAKAHGAPDTLFFTCHRANAPKVDRAALTAHRNGVTGIRAVVLAASDPARAIPVLELLARASARPGDDGFIVDLDGTRLDIMTPSAIERRHGLTPPAEASLVLAAIAFVVPDGAPFERLLPRDIHHVRTGDGLTVPPAPGQGTAFLFGA